MKGPILSLANSTVYPIYGHSHFCEKKNKAANFWSWKICSPQTLEEVDFHRILFGFCNLEPTPAGCGSSRNELTSLVGDLPKAQAWRVSSLQLLLSGWWEDLGCRPLGLKHLKTFETYVPSVGSSCVAGMTGISRKRDTEHRINPFNKDGLGAPVFCCLGLNLEVHFFSSPGYKFSSGPLTKLHAKPPVWWREIQVGVFKQQVFTHPKQIAKIHGHLTWFGSESSWGQWLYREAVQLKHEALRKDQSNGLALSDPMVDWQKKGVNTIRSEIRFHVLRWTGKRV